MVGCSSGTKCFLAFPCNSPEEEQSQLALCSCFLPWSSPRRGHSSTAWWDQRKRSWKPLSYIESSGLILYPAGESCDTCTAWLLWGTCVVLASSSLNHPFKGCSSWCSLGTQELKFLSPLHSCSFNPVSEWGCFFLLSGLLKAEHTADTGF